MGEREGVQSKSPSKLAYLSSDGGGAESDCAGCETNERQEKLIRSTERGEEGEREELEFQSSQKRI